MKRTTGRVKKALCGDVDSMFENNNTLDENKTATLALVAPEQRRGYRTKSVTKNPAPKEPLVLRQAVRSTFGTAGRSMHYTRYFFLTLRKWSCCGFKMNDAAMLGRICQGDGLPPC
jgi:hypothetical protein